MWLRAFQPVSALAAALATLAFTQAASAFGLSYGIRGGQLSSYSTSDAVVVDIFLDAPDPGLSTIEASIRVESAVLSYDAAGSAALPVVHPAPSYGTTGAAPGYILYSAAPAVYMLPLSNPWQTWPAPPPGQTQVDVQYVEANLGQTSATGTNIWIASLLFHVTADFDTTDIVLDTSEPEVQVYLPITLSGHLPEPTTALLLGLALLTASAAGRQARG
jgi:hypothetical protein